MKPLLNDLIIQPSATITDAMGIIQKTGARGVFVCEDGNVLLGMVMDSDIRRAILKHGKLDVSVRTIMKTMPFVLRQGMTLEERKQAFLESGKLLAPVVDADGKVVDYLFLIDALQASLADKADEQGLFPPARILVVGGAGYIGAPLAGRLLRMGYKVRVFDLMLYDNKTIDEFIGNENFEFMRGDCRDTELLEKALEGVDGVVHLGEIVGDPACSVDEDFTIDTNYISTTKLVECCVKQGIPRFVFTSSCSVYGQNDEIVDETSALHPVSLYARCKIECERIIMQTRYEGFCPTVMRLSTVHGLSQRQRFDLVVNLLTIKGLAEGKIQIFGGDQWRPFISVKDICRGIITVLQAPRNKVCHGVFNLGDNRENFTINQVGDILKKLLPEVVVERPEGVDDVRNYRVSFDRIRTTLGFACEYSIEDTIRDLIRAYNEEGRFQDYKDSKYSNVMTLK
ncbi:MAG: NAD-dependent epimerase/dehydratase family protein [Desulfovibrio sp.]